MTSPFESVLLLHADFCFVIKIIILLPIFFKYIHTLLKSNRVPILPTNIAYPRRFVQVFLQKMYAGR